MEVPYILISTISPEKGKKIDAFDKHTKYVSKVLAPTDFQKCFLNMQNIFFEAAHKITEFILSAEHPYIGKLDTYFFSIAFLYRHCMELGLKAIGFQSIQDKDQRKRFVKETRHNLSVILSICRKRIESQIHSVIRFILYGNREIGSVKGNLQLRNDVAAVTFVNGWVPVHEKLPALLLLLTVTLL